MKSGQVPADWKEGNVVPVFKGGCRNVATDYYCLKSSQFKTVCKFMILNWIQDA